MAQEIFERSVKEKVRFNTDIGSLLPEDLFDLPLTGDTAVNLDDLAKSLNREVKASAEESFVKKATRTNSTLKLKLDIVKRVIEIKLEDTERRENAAATRARKTRLTELLAQKRDAKDADLSEDEILKLIEEL